MPHTIPKPCREDRPRDDVNMDNKKKVFLILAKIIKKD
jgi:hypothetical protein